MPMRLPRLAGLCLRRSALVAILVVAACSRESDGDAWLALDGPALADALAAGRVSAEEVTSAVLDRIAAIDDAGPKLNAIIEINPDAIEIARSLDRTFEAGGPVGPLHGVPVVLKANIDTADAMATSAGSLALADHHAAADADLVARLRAAGAVIVAKANLSEWANFRSTSSSSGWSSLGGQTKNPYVLDRNPCGSSSGSAVAVAARLVPLAVGTETNGSIVCPAAINGVVGIKPTVGLVSQAGIIPVSATQDTAGPMARSVRGAALLLAAMQAEGPATYAVERENLDGLRIGVLRDYFGAGNYPEIEALYTRWLAMLEAAGAELIDPVALELPPGGNAAELEVLLYEFKDGINDYLSTANTGLDSLEALIRFNADNADEVMPDFGQELLLMAQAHGDLDEPAYREALESSHLAVRNRLVTVFGYGNLDAIAAPANGPAWKTDSIYGDSFYLGSTSFAATAGYPIVTVPGGRVRGLPVGIAFVGESGSEALLIEIAAVFEDARGPVPAPEFLPTLEE